MPISAILFRFMKHIRTSLATGIALVAFLIPTSSAAYLTPFDVLLGDDLYLPPAQREAEDRVAAQQAASAERREREQEANYRAQHGAPEEPALMEDEEELHGSAPEVGGETDERLEALEAENEALWYELELLLEDDEDEREVLSAEMHGGAPLLPRSPRPLAPTGAGTVAAMGAIALAMGWTLKRSGKGEIRITK